MFGIYNVQSRHAGLTNSPIYLDRRRMKTIAKRRNSPGRQYVQIMDWQLESNLGAFCLRHGRPLGRASNWSRAEHGSSRA